jgi:hypothetical protein
MNMPAANPKKGVTWPNYFVDAMTIAKEGDVKIGGKTLPVERDAVPA